MLQLVLMQARTRLRGLKGIHRFRGVVIEEGHYSEIRARWVGMVVESRMRQKKLESQIKLDSKLHEVEWRANSNQYFGQSYYDLGKESWGWSWSWKERWVVVRPWEKRYQTSPTPIKKVEAKQKRSEVTNPATTKPTAKQAPPNGKDSKKTAIFANLELL